MDIKGYSFKGLICLSMCLIIVAIVSGGCSYDNTWEAEAAPSSGTAGNTRETVPGTETPVTITIAWPKDDDDALTGYSVALKVLNKKWPYISVKKDNRSYEVDSFLPRAASGQLQNVFATFYTESQKIIDAGYCAELTQAAKKYGYDTTIHPNILKISMREGRIYGIPANGYVIGMWYNVNLFKKAGLVDDKGIPKFPNTYEELIKTAQIIKEKTGQAGFFFPSKGKQGGWMSQNIFWAFGAKFETKINGKWVATFNSQEGVTALQYIKDLKYKYNVLQDNILLNSSDDMPKMFAADQVAMAFASLDWLSYPVQRYNMDKNNIAMSVLPNGPKGNDAVFGGNLYMCSSYSTPEQIDASFHWFEALGCTPNISQDVLDSFGESYQNQNKAGLIVGPVGLQIFKNTEYLEKIDKMMSKYRNVNLDLYNNYSEGATKNARLEEPIAAQNLYEIMDSVIQAALSDKNSNCKELLDKAAAQFQKDFLNKVG